MSVEEDFLLKTRGQGELKTCGDVLNYIHNRRLSEWGVSDRQVMTEVKDKCGFLEFGLCREMDKRFDTGDYGGYWRTTYGFPECGDTRSPPWAKEEKYVVVSVGFFTFHMVSAGEYEKIMKDTEVSGYSCIVCGVSVSQKQAKTCHGHRQMTRCREHEFSVCRKHGRYRVHELDGCEMCAANAEARILG